MRPARLEPRFQFRAADQTDLAGGDLGGVEAPRQQRPIGPVDPHVGGFQPDSLGVGDGDALQAEIIEQVALQPLDVDAAVAADLLAGHEAGDQFAPGIGHQIHPPADGQKQDHGQQAGHHDAADEGGQFQAGALALRRFRWGIGGGVLVQSVRRRSVGQNAWPMLM
ncbi:hypothetical protein D3C80_1019440 [compost metagenome]